MHAASEIVDGHANCATSAPGGCTCGALCMSIDRLRRRGGRARVTRACVPISGRARKLRRSRLLAAAPRERPCDPGVHVHRRFARAPVNGHARPGHMLAPAAAPQRMDMQIAPQVHPAGALVAHLHVHRLRLAVVCMCTRRWTRRPGSHARTRRGAATDRWTCKVCHKCTRRVRLWRNSHVHQLRRSTTTSCIARPHARALAYKVRACPPQRRSGLDLSRGRAGR